MVRIHVAILFLWLGYCGISSCRNTYQARSIQYASYLMQGRPADTSMFRFLEPYAGAVRRRMEDSIGYLPISLSKGLPDGTLGNFLADSYLQMARQKYDSSVQLAFINHGGIRLNAIQSGVLRRRTVFEVMPFDNELVIVRLTGEALLGYLNHIAAEGGGGAAGLTMHIKDGKATKVYVQGKPLDRSASYVMANSDYTVLSGSYAGLRTLPVRRTGYLLRDATIDYCLAFRAKGMPVEVSTEKRILYDQ